MRVWTEKASSKEVSGSQLRVKLDPEAVRTLKRLGKQALLNECGIRQPEDEAARIKSAVEKALGIDPAI